MTRVGHGIYVRRYFEHLPAAVLCHVLGAIDVQGFVRVHRNQHLAYVGVDFVVLEPVDKKISILDIESIEQAVYLIVLAINDVWG